MWKSLIDIIKGRPFSVVVRNIWSILGKTKERTCCLRVEGSQRLVMDLVAPVPLAVIAPAMSLCWITLQMLGLAEHVAASWLKNKMRTIFKDHRGYSQVPFVLQFSIHSLKNDLSIGLNSLKTPNVWTSLPSKSRSSSPNLPPSLLSRFFVAVVREKTW